MFKRNVMNSKKKYIIWIGSIYEEDCLKENVAISPAANYWQISFLKGLQSNNEKVVLLSTHFQRIFPFGDFIPNGSKFWKKGFNIISSLYFNLPLLKPLTIFLGFKIRIYFWKKNAGVPKCIITYNPTFENCKIALSLKKKYSIPWIDLCADSYYPGRNWENYSKVAKSADAHVFLSFFAYTSCPFNNLFHFDGGIDSGKINFSSLNSSNEILLYSGMLGEYGGVDLLLESFLKIKNPNLRLIICGYGKCSSFFQKSIISDSRIVFYGLISNSELEKLYDLANIFVNPRPEEIDGGEMNFPSKIHKYLSYGKPIISTKTLGISPEYDDFLFYFDSKSVNSLENVISHVVNLNFNERLEYLNKIKKYIELEKNWDIQTKKFLGWMNSKSLIE